MYLPQELLLAELDLREQQGFTPEAIFKLRTAVTKSPLSPTEANQFWQQIADLPRVPNWPYDEPDALAEIQQMTESVELPTPVETVVPTKIHGGLLGRFAGMMLGKPLEGTWPAAQIWRYLELAGAFPLQDYVPLLEPFPDGFTLPVWSRWYDTTRGNIRRVVQDDDVEYTLAAMLILQKHGFNFTTADVGQFWLDNFAYGRVFTAERVVYKHLVNGVSAETAAALRNPYREWIGAQIRADVYGYVCPGQPRRAAALAYKDAALSHRGNGIYGAMWVAAMVSAAFVLNKPEAIIRAGLAEIPPQSRLHEAVEKAIGWAKQEATWEDAFRQIKQYCRRYYNVDVGENWIHTIPNACLVTLGLLLGADDFSAGVGTAVSCGWDTDCNGATVGSILGVMLGADNIPARWTAPLNDEIESYIPGENGRAITDLAQQITQMARY
ncbi:ADP-ribosylglycohydrolase family protein [Candidatus Leptofilum sp.]|uniref:ADP-ribosylglycohydrolase family protein n=1 Tax=Candidatus Leptofilum sp. TaxID=3241576 RepID=UPI003B58BD10